jgi:hypothetical protein
MEQLAQLHPAAQVAAFLSAPLVASAILYFFYKITSLD